MTWTLWVSEKRDSHLIENVNVSPLGEGHEPPPWHTQDGFCPCQPRVIKEDKITGRRIICHNDPVN